MEESDSFSLAFFPEENRDDLKFCGSHSGRDTDKIGETGLTPVRTPAGNWAYQEARLIIECKTMYFQDFTPDNFIDPSIEKLYSNNDYHRMYIGEIVAVHRKS
jgi:flavin reductase (DIM6/NTAB) family NADH-FMN oxidoreductase RutF